MPSTVRTLWSVPPSAAAAAWLGLVKHLAVAFDERHAGVAAGNYNARAVFLSCEDYLYVEDVLVVRLPDRAVHGVGKALYLLNLLGCDAGEHLQLPPGVPSHYPGCGCGGEARAASLCSAR